MPSDERPRAEGPLSNSGGLAADLTLEGARPARDVAHELLLMLDGVVPLRCLEGDRHAGRCDDVTEFIERCRIPGSPPEAEPEQSFGAGPGPAVVRQSAREVANGVVRPFLTGGGNLLESVMLSDIRDRIATAIERDRAATQPPPQPPSPTVSGTQPPMGDGNQESVGGAQSRAVDVARTLVEDLESEANLRDAVAAWVEQGSDILGGGTAEDAQAHRVIAGRLRAALERLRKGIAGWSSHQNRTSGLIARELVTVNGGPLGAINDRERSSPPASSPASHQGAK